MQSLATLTAQRPTLRELLAKGEQTSLSAYLHILQEGSGLDLVLVCNSGRIIAQAGQAFPGELCPEEGQIGYYTTPVDPLPQVWLLAAHPLDGEVNESAEAVVMGMAMNDEFTRQMSAETRTGRSSASLPSKWEPPALTFLHRKRSWMRSPN